MLLVGEIVSTPLPPSESVRSIYSPTNCDMELNSKTIGSPRVYEEAAKAMQRANTASKLSMLWLMFVLALIPFVAGFVVGGQVNESTTAWAATVIAK